MTPRRFRRLKETLDRRQPDLTVVLEDVHKGHNFGAIVRTCDAAGVFEAHAVVTRDREEHPAKLRRSRTPFAGTGDWVEVSVHNRIDDAVTGLRDRGFQVLGANLSERAVDFRKPDYTRPTAFLLGQEKKGVSEHAAALCDGEVLIPMVGLVESLNVSVAAALLLFEAQRQRQEAGFYEPGRLEALDPERYRRTLFEWCHPKLAQRFRDEGTSYPELGEDGEVLGEAPR